MYCLYNNINKCIVPEFEVCPLFVKVSQQFLQLNMVGVGNVKHKVTTYTELSFLYQTEVDTNKQFPSGKTSPLLGYILNLMKGR